MNNFGKLTGQVINYADGQPIKGCAVKLTGEWADGPLAGKPVVNKFTTGSDGKFMFFGGREFPFKKSHTLDLSAPGLDSRRISNVIFSHDKDVDLGRLVMGVESLVAQVVGPNGQGIEGCSVKLGGPVSEETITDSSGRFAFYGLAPANDYSLFLGTGADSGLYQNIVVLKDRKTDLGRLILSPPK